MSEEMACKKVGVINLAGRKAKVLKMAEKASGWLNQHEERVSERKKARFDEVNKNHYYNCQNRGTGGPNQRNPRKLVKRKNKPPS